MATVTDQVVTQNSNTTVPSSSISIKKLAESSQLTYVPSTYKYTDTPQHEAVLIDNEAKVPIVDFSLLTDTSPEQRSKAISDLGKACEDWGCFLVINHGVPEELMKSVMDGSLRFFDLSEEEKHEYEGKHVLDPIRCGTSFNASVDKVMFWRDFLKVLVHPEFHFPDKPTGFSELSSEYCKRTREITWELLKGISESLGLEADYLDKALNVEAEGLQIFIANLYPPCPQPELALGMPPHSDHGLLTLLIQNGISGLQVLHNGKWVNVDAIPYSFLVNTGDHLEIFSNGKYKSNIHRARLNNKATRISIAVPTGPSLDVVVTPAAELVENGHHPPAFVGMKYKDYLELQQSSMLDGKAVLDRYHIYYSSSTDPIMPEQSEVSSQFKPHVAAQLVPVLLTEDYYSLWKSFLVPVLKNYDMFNMVQGIEQPLTEDKDRKCMSFINLTLSESMLPYAAEACSSSRALWLKLEEEGRIAKIRLVQLSSRLGKLKKGKFTSMSKYYQMKKTMADRLKAAGSPVSDREFTKHVLNGLPYEYGAFSKPIIGALIAGTDELTPEELHDLLVNEESRRREYQKEEYSRREQRCPREQRRNTAINYGRFSSSVLSSVLSLVMQTVGRML